MKLIRIGVCKKCGKSFKTDEDKFESIKSFWKPELCLKCKKKQLKKRK